MSLFSDRIISCSALVSAGPSETRGLWASLVKKLDMFPYAAVVVRSRKQSSSSFYFDLGAAQQNTLHIKLHAMRTNTK
jgi:hypothetical protein